MGTKVGFVCIAKREIEDPAVILCCKIAHGLFNMILDKAGRIFVVFIKNPATEQTEGRDKSAIA